MKFISTMLSMMMIAFALSCGNADKKDEEPVSDPPVPNAGTAAEVDRVDDMVKDSTKLDSTKRDTTHH